MADDPRLAMRAMAFAVAPEALLILDADGRVADANDAAIELLGLDPAGKRLPELAPADEQAGLEAALRGCREARSGLIELTLGGKGRLAFRTVESGGWLHLRAIPASAPRTVSRQLEELQRLDAVSVLAGGLTHHLNNLLCIVVGYSNILLEALETQEGLKPYANEIQSAADRAAGLVRQLEVFARKQDVNPMPLDLNQVLQGAGAMLGHLLTEKVVLELDLDPEGPRVVADRGQLEQLLLNLVINAKDAMPRGGRMVLATRAGIRGGDGTVPPGDYALLTVSDTGCGLTPDVQARMFEPFFTTKEVGKGTGLGLATVYGTIKQAGGAVTVESQPDRGTTFRIYWPAAPAVEAPRPLPERTLSTGRHTLLVVEDDPRIRAMIERGLGQRGFQVLVAVDATEALDLAQRHGSALDLLLTDVVMPGMNGPALVEQIRQATPDLRVLYMSGYGAAMASQIASSIQAAQLIEKPFTVAALATRVREALGSGSRTGSSCIRTGNSDRALQGRRR